MPVSPRSGGTQCRVSSPAADSTLITSAPRSASSIVQYGPASTRLKSATTMPRERAAAQVFRRHARVLCGRRAEQRPISRAGGHCHSAHRRRSRPRSAATAGGGRGRGCRRWSRRHARSRSSPPAPRRRRRAPARRPNGCRAPVPRRPAPSPARGPRVSSRATSRRLARQERRQAGSARLGERGRQRRRLECGEQHLALRGVQRREPRADLHAQRDDLRYGDTGNVDDVRPVELRHRRRLARGATRSAMCGRAMSHRPSEPT